MTDFLGRELPDEQPTAQTVEEFAVEQGNAEPDTGEQDGTEPEQTTEDDPNQ